MNLGFMGQGDTNDAKKRPLGLVAALPALGNLNK